MNQWVSKKGLDASFLDRIAVLQQVINTMVAIHNSGNDKSLWGCFLGKQNELEGSLREKKVIYEGRAMQVCMKERRVCTIPERS